MQLILIYKSHDLCVGTQRTVIGKDARLACRCRFFTLFVLVLAQSLQAAWCNKDQTVSDDESLKGVDIHCRTNSFYAIAARERDSES